MRLPELDNTKAGAVAEDGEGEGDGVSDDSPIDFWLNCGDIIPFSRSLSAPSTIDEAMVD